jgi:hypothetical protein
MGGCADTYRYVGNETYTEQKWNQDVYECQRDQMMARGPSAVGQNPYGQNQANMSNAFANIAAERLFVRCMNAKGYVKE